MRTWPSLVVRFPADADDLLRDYVSGGFDPDEVAAIEERSAHEWLVSFRNAAARDAAQTELAAAYGPRAVGAEAVDVSDQDWARRSQADLGAVRAGCFVVTPPWLALDDEPAGAVRLIIEPSMGFGSGHHPTTRLCLLALQQLPVTGARVLDIGTGSGILAIGAARLGAAAVAAVDHDPDALAAARAGAATNGVLSRVRFAELDFRSSALEPADIVLANITGAVLAAHADVILACVAPNGHAVLSGITTAEADNVLRAFGRARVVSRTDDTGWVGLVVAAPDAA